MKKTILVLSLLSLQIKAAETDQFYARDAVIRDSVKELNGYFHQKIDKALVKVNNQKKSIECRDVALEVLTQVLGEFNISEYVKDGTFSKVSRFTQKDSSVERFPEDSLDQKIYRENSIYKNRPFPVNIVGVASTINVDGIYMGTDKIGHFSIVGKAYYKNFLEEIRKGKNVDEASEIAIFKGFKQEVAILGYTVGGTLSYGDLEANYQGMMFGRNMCEGQKPHLVFIDGKWSQNTENIFDLKDYVNPKLDEAYNVSLWSKRMWRKMKKEIIEGYCLNKMNENFIARAEEYKKRTNLNFNDLMIAKFLKSNPKFERTNQLLSPKIKCE